MRIIQLYLFCWERPTWRTRTTTNCWPSDRASVCTSFAKTEKGKSMRTRWDTRWSFHELWIGSARAVPHPTNDLDIWVSYVPPELVRASFVMLFKNKGSVNDPTKYRCIGLLPHSYKILSLILLERIQRECSGFLSDWQAGFRPERGCRDNILLLRVLSVSYTHLTLPTKA